MSQPLISTLEVKPADRRSIGNLEENDIYTLYKTDPYLMDNVLSAALAKSSGKNTLGFIIESFGSDAKGMLSVNKREIQWNLGLRPDNAWSIAKSPEEIYSQTSITNIGAGGQEFKVGLTENPFVEDDLVTPEDERYQLLVRGMYQDGLYYIYTFVLATNDVNFVPSSQLQVGKKLIRRYTPKAEGSDRGGKPMISTDITLRNCGTTLRMSYAVTRHAAKTVMTISFANPENPSQKFTTYVDMVDWNFLQQWDNDRAYCLLESKYNQGVNLPNIIKDNSNRPIYMGAGILDQISPSNIFYHNYKISYKQIEDWFTTLAQEVTQYGTDTEFTWFVGIGLQSLIDQAITKEFSTTAFPNVIQEGATFLEGKGNSLSYYAPVFKKLYLRNGIVVNLVRFDVFSDTYFYKEKAQGSPYTKKSFEGFVINLGKNKQGKRNIIRFNREDSLNMLWTVNGSISPSGKVSTSASGRDGYEIHALTDEGVIIPDPTGTARMIPVS